MAKIKGSWQDVASNPNYYQASKSDISSAVSKLAAVANKRLKRLENVGIDYGKDFAVEERIAGVKKFGAKGKNLGELRSEFKRLVGFLKSPISTLTGRKEEFYQAKKRVWQHSTPKEREMMGGQEPTRKEAYKEYIESQKRKQEHKKAYDEKWGVESQYFIDEAEMFDEVSRLFQVARNRGWMARSATLQKMQASDQIREYYQEQVIRARMYGMDLITFIEQDLGIDSPFEVDEEDTDVSTSNFF